MVQIGGLTISPPLLNSSCAWASDLEQLTALYDCRYTGAVTTRTATVGGFPQDESHGVCFSTETLSSLNSYGYSPHPLAQYLTWIEGLISGSSSSKPFLISTTASEPSTLQAAVDVIQTLRAKSVHYAERIGVEFNTSCPNIRGHPPPGYAPELLQPLLEVLAAAWRKDPTLTLGLKLPPYVHAGQFTGVVEKCPFAYVACTNTLGNSLLFAEQVEAPLRGEEFAVPPVLGGLAGDALHPLALGNVYSFKKLFEKEALDIAIFGIGGVTSKEAVARMTKAGASVEGVKAFEILT
ncbi:hypothetical protein FB45DRAFT_915466 [Roridomyces roridus]|uniref:Dihydroorotate oxidase n=1 Tax=Roridomyces roridus TaxID=1738132 RepID=A0AAD7BTR5_9AGAR|nr:hypothetical protein FB45DRAFT_915466 [Roridomyces roridus]